MKLKTKLKVCYYLLKYHIQKPKITVNEACLSGDGSFVDVRYWISRPSLIKPKPKIFLIHEESGEKLNLMKMTKFGTIRTRHHKLKYAGFLLFYNRDGIVKQGDRVTLYYEQLVSKSVMIKS